MRVPLAHLAGLAAALLLLVASLAPAQTTRPTGQGRAVVIVVDGMVDDYLRDSLKKRYGEAVELGADAIVLRIDTYGGLVTSGLEISRFIKQSDLPVHAFVDEKAISAGSMIALACDSLAMEPASQIGDSGVIAMGGDLADTERAKAESPVLADFDDSARRNGYDPLLARAFVKTDAVVYAIEHVETGEIAFVSSAEAHAERTDSDDAAWRDVPNVPVPLDSKDSLLTMSNETAAAIGLSVGTFATADAFAESLGFGVSATMEPTTGERLVGFLSSFAVRGALMTVLFLSVYVAFTTPGTGFPEAVAAMALGVLFGIPYLTGYAEWYEILFVVGGIALLAVEIFVIPGFGIFGIAGLVGIVIGLALTFVGPILPGTVPAGVSVDWSRLGTGAATTLGAMVVSLLLWAWLARFLPTLPYANRMILKDVEPSEQAVANAIAWPPIGSQGSAVTDLRPGGTAEFAVTSEPGDTSHADVITDRGFIAAGTPLVVVEAKGNRIVVRPAELA